LGAALDLHAFWHGGPPPEPLPESPPAVPGPSRRSATATTPSSQQWARRTGWWRGKTGSGYERADRRGADPGML